MLLSTEIRETLTPADARLYLIIDKLLYGARIFLQKTGKKRLYSFECHSICRALILEIADGSIACVDGQFVGLDIKEDLSVEHHACCHSWLVTKSGSLIDPYPVGTLVMSPLLFPDSKLKPFTIGRYRPCPEVMETVSIREIWRKARVLQSLFHAKPPSIA